jgi:NAD(P)H-dependent FMN reductase
VPCTREEADTRFGAVPSAGSTLTKNSGMGSPVKLMAAAAGSVGGTDARAQLARIASVFQARAAANKACVALDFAAQINRKMQYFATTNNMLNR